MTSVEQVQTAVRTVASVVDGPADVVRPRRVGKQGRRTRRSTTHCQRTEQNAVSDTGRETRHPQSLLARVADNTKGRVMSQRRQETSRTEGGDNSKARAAKQRRSTRNSRYAGAKFTGGAPSASLLPFPPAHWLTVA